ncbi:MAG: heat-inducible transcription repressor HrcA [Tissierellales bacterium]|nr:heat-inducible transcription repressor HrcA [Tissierellales bacterium]
MLDERKLKILLAVIDSYIVTGEPIGSRTITKFYDLGVSSATIRNEMSDLEDLGYLNKTHTSSGRVPSDKAYRFYVDNFFQNSIIELDNNKKEQIKKFLKEEYKEIDQLIQDIAKVLSQLTKYTAVALSPQIKETKIKHIQLLQMDENQILVIMVNETGLIKKSTINLDKTISEDNLMYISNYLSKKFKNKTFTEITNEINKDILDDYIEYKNEIKKLIPMLSRTMDDYEGLRVYADGLTNIFEFPEYRDVDKAKEVISLLEDKQKLIFALNNTNLEDIDVKIGEENNNDSMKDLSIISATYNTEGEIVGKIGIIGPKRMNYIELIKTIRTFSESISDIIDDYFNSNER